MKGHERPGIYKALDEERAKSERLLKALEGLARNSCPKDGEYYESFGPLNAEGLRCLVEYRGYTLIGGVENHILVRAPKAKEGS